jgi:hypothetical protein
MTASERETMHKQGSQAHFMEVTVVIGKVLVFKVDHIITSD